MLTTGTISVPTTPQLPLQESKKEHWKKKKKCRGGFKEQTSKQKDEKGKEMGSRKRLRKSREKRKKGIQTTGTESFG